MNTNPDESTLALWLDDELTGAELAAVEVWASSQPDQLAARAEVRRWRATMAATLPASIEPPYPDFFNSRVLQAIREQDAAVERVVKNPSSWRSWLMPMAACAGMVMAFWIGKKSQTAIAQEVVNAPRAIPVGPVVYTPESGVKAEWISGSKASATVIVLNGVTAIPDATDFSATVYVPMDREIDSTADSEAQPELGVGP